jgi:mRNA interferase ChpB
MSHRIIQRGDVFWINPDPTNGREIKGMHRFVVITPKEINKLGVVTTVPVTTGGSLVRKMGLAVSVIGHDTTGIAICNQIRSFDLESRLKANSAKYIETLDKLTIDEIVYRVISVIDPAD